MTVAANEPDRKPDCVVLDTNVWRSDLLLKTPVGTSLAYALGRQGGFVGLPEVVERELKKQVVQAGIDAADNLLKYSRIVNTLTDWPFPPGSVPTRDDLEKKVDARLTELSPILVRAPFTLEHAKAALDMVNAKVPPNGPENQQFKDSAIWQAVLTLARDYTTHLVTNDRAFLLDRGDPSKGLAANLIKDCNSLDLSVRVYCDLSSCLKAITADAPMLDQTRLTPLIMEAIKAPLLAKAARHNFEIGQMLGVELQVFRTGQTNRVAIDYSVRSQFAAPPSVMADGRTDCRSIVHGSCYYDMQTESIMGTFIGAIIFEWNDPMGRRCRYASGFDNENPSILFPRPMRPD